MSVLADLLSTIFERRYRGDPHGDWSSDPIEDLVHDLLGRRGEVSGIALGRHILDRYARMDEDEKRAFFEILVRRMDIDPDTVRAALKSYEADPSKETYRAFMAAAEPRRQEFARRLNQVPGATARLVAMRNDLLKLAATYPTLAALDLDFRHLFASWFNRGFLVLRPINWESPAHILEKIIAYEAVHAIDSWEALRRRLQPVDRRCFAFFHPAMPDEPLIFVEVALTQGVPGSIQTVLAEERSELDPDAADTAVFYSISNCQSGLAGISFGNSLIKQVVEDLSRDMPQLKTFVTLSPIPGLMRWFDETGQTAPMDEPEDLRGLAARYLLDAKRPDGLPYDPVARFHLGNGALIHDVHAGADLSANGLSQSGGAMVNYLYDLSRISQNHETFAGKREIVASQRVRNLARSAIKSEA